MKTAILTAAMIVLMTAANARTLPDSTNSNTTGEKIFKAWVIQPEDNIIKFRVKNPFEEKVVLKIYNDKKVKVFQRNSKKVEKFGLSCDMTNCGPGTYTAVVIKNGKEELRKVITLD